MCELADESQCLNDRMINAAQQLLSLKYPTLSGLYDTVAVAACEVRLDTNAKCNTVQIVHDPVKKHWFCVTDKHCAEGQLSIYCSLQMTPSTQSIATISKLYHMQVPTLTINVMNVIKQNGAIDCGLFSIAYAEMLANDRDPCNFVFDQLLMRKHLVKCLEAKRILSFPVTKHRTIRRAVVRSTVLSLYCICRSICCPGETMIRCNDCREWYHQRCLGMSDINFEHFSQPSVPYSCCGCRGLGKEDVTDDQVNLMNLAFDLHIIHYLCHIYSCDKILS
jgi:hypothetical protein